MTVTYLIRSIRYIINRFLFKKTFLIGKSAKYQVDIKFKTEDGGGRKIYKRGVYEEELTDYLLNHLEPTKGDVYLDVGANVGWYAVTLSRQLAIKPRILAFEPDNTNYECLQENIVRNLCENVEAYKLAISDQNGTGQLNRYKNSNVGRHSMLPINEGDAVTVDTVALDQFLVSKSIAYDRVKFVKIDIEGYELLAFRGAQSLLSVVPLILAEYSPGYMRKGGLNPEDLLTFMMTENYHANKLVAGSLVPLTEEELLKMNKNINLFWVKKS
ncbi:MAG: FkbM family methyltransferase [Cyclobacteriaceae bacterium]